MSDDDKPHEYVPQLAIYNAQALGEKIALMDSLEVAEAERNNLAEAVRVVNQRLVDVTKERDAARQSRKRLIVLVDYWRSSIFDWNERFHREQARAVQAEAERDAWQKIAQDTRDEAREYVSELRDLSEWKRGYPRYVEELGRLDAFIAAMKDDLK